MRKAGVVQIETKTEQGLNPNPEPPEPSGQTEQGLSTSIPTAGREKVRAANSKRRKRKVKNEKDFDESKHPRDESGKFGKGGGGSKKKDEKSFAKDKIDAAGKISKVPESAKSAKKENYYSEKIIKRYELITSKGKELKNKYPKMDLDSAIVEEDSKDKPIISLEALALRLDPADKAFLRSSFYETEKPEFTTGWRYGKAPKGGQSTNFREDELEKGVSFMETGKTDKISTTYEMFSGDAKNVKWYAGFEIYQKGSDGEPLMVNVVSLKKAV